MEEVFGNNELEDVSWLCSLSETELDLLVHLKELVMQRAHIIGNNDLADSFDLKLLRTLGMFSFPVFMLSILDFNSRF